ncbi:MULTISPECIES: hypothetical protein [unclassified Streptomyces]|jgi:hypothetical protein|uniref:hypothetical protein n=1 Tax=unclassified Streptomyces TaxID=2593676 RepID=UPI0033AB53C1
MLHNMSTTPETARRRTAAEVNEEIRDLLMKSGGRLDHEQRRRYQRLVGEWAAATPRPKPRRRPARAS